MSGKRVPAERAESDGLVDYVRPRAELDSFVREFVDRITTGAPLAVRAAKDVTDTEEEGQRAFREDREPE